MNYKNSIQGTQRSGNYLSIRESANYIGISERNLRYLISGGQIKSVRIGKRKILRKCDLDRLMESNLK